MTAQNATSQLDGLRSVLNLWNMKTLFKRAMYAVLLTAWVWIVTTDFRVSEDLKLNPQHLTTAALNRTTATILAGSKGMLGRTTTTAAATRMATTDDTPKFHTFLDFMSVNSRIIRNNRILNNRGALGGFQKRLSKRDKRIYKDLIDKFSAIAKTNDIPYMLYSGTLLGSYRHHGMIPWDDDIDLLINSADLGKLIEAAKPLPPQYFIRTHKYRWKVFSSLSHPVKGLSWQWPFLDINLYKENETHIWDSDPRFDHLFVFEKNIIFPTTIRPFMGSMHSVPRDSLAVLRKTFNVSLCRTNFYDHEHERPVPGVLHRKVPCEKLKGLVPLVQREFLPGGINETLYIGDNIIHSIFLNVTSHK